MIKRTLLYLFLFFNCQVFAQTVSSSWRLKINECLLSNGYIYQKEHVYEVGLKIDYIKENKKNIAENISLIVGGQVARHNKTTYFNPFGTIRYLRPITDRIGSVLAVSYSYRKELGMRSNTFTPEVGININGISTISYGYNIFEDNKVKYLSKHRIAFRLMLF